MHPTARFATRSRSRRTFFEHLRALIHYLPFDDWDHLMQFMIKRPDPQPLDTG